jgi:hypothetical protein
MREAALAGRNIHQLSLDRQNQVQAFAATLSPEDALKFWTLYGDEMQAVSQAVLDQANRTNAQTAAKHLQYA